MRWGYFALCLLAVGSVITMAFAEDGVTPRPRPANLQIDRRVVTAMNDLGFRLFADLAREGDTKNVFISPASIQLALAMTYNGAGGATQEAMAKAMGVSALTRDEVNQGNAQLISLLQNPDPKVELAIANSLWGRQGIAFKPDFLGRVGTAYQAKLTTLDFMQPAAADTINKWVSDSTRGKIPTLVNQEMLQDALMVLVNAIYFKGAWTDPFDPKLTKDGPFTLANGTKKTLPMMFQRGKYPYRETATFQAISLPYGERNVVMDIVLPKAGVKPADFRTSLTSANWTQWTAQMHSREGSIFLPRFKAKYETGLKPALAAQGMGPAFGDQANFSNLLVDEKIRAYISEAIHKTVLEVNEEGTVAAAVTGMIVATLSMPVDPPFVMTVDRPFFCAIRDVPTGTILFMGWIGNPE